MDYLKINHFFLLTIIVSCCFHYSQAQITSASRDYTKDYEHSAGFKDANGKWVVQPSYNYTYWNSSRGYGEFEITNNGARGLIDKWGKVIFKADKFKHYNLTESDNGYLICEGFDGTKALAKTNGEILIPLGSYNGYYISEKYGYIECGSKDGSRSLFTIDLQQITKLGKYLSYNKYYKNKGFLCAESTDGGMVLLSLDGKELISDGKYTDFYIGDNFIEATCKDGTKALFTLNSEVVYPSGKYTKYGTWEAKSCNIIYLNTGELKGVGTTGGKEILKPNYSSLWLTGKKYFICKQNNKYGVFDINGKRILPFEYDSVLYNNKESEAIGTDLLLIKRNGKWGVYAQGRDVISCEYDDCVSFTNGVATAKKDGEVKLIKNPLRQEGGAQIMMAGNAQGAKKKRGPAVSRYPAPNSDVDKNIPVAKSSNKNSFAVIVANENYPDAPVPYSLNDGRMFKEYCNKTLGIPEKNISLYEDATYGNLIEAVEKIKNIADAFDGEASLIFYYAGHGFPDEKQSTAYLLPIDGNAGDITSTGYSLAKLYDQLARINLKSSIVFLDACFSGAKREDQMLSQSRGVAIKVREEEPKGKMVVFSAAQGDETAHQLEEKGHGLFTYYLLKQLQAKGGELTMGELSDFVTKQVKRQSVVINNKKQTPEIIPSPSLSTTWRDMKLK